MKKINRLVFIDDSGDPGFSFDKGSSRFFVLAAIIVDSAEEVEIISLGISKLKKTIGVSESIEVKFNKLDKLQRTKFLKGLSSFKFSADVILLDKQRLVIRKHVYSEAIRNLLYRSKDLLEGANIKIDGKIDNLLKKYLLKQIKFVYGTRAKIGFTKSSNNMIQLADMIAGSMRRSFESKKNDRFIYIDLIKNKIRKIHRV